MFMLVMTPQTGEGRGGGGNGGGGGGGRKGLSTAAKVLIAALTGIAGCIVVMMYYGIG